MTKKFKLKPGRHQFAPGSHAIHNNDNLSDEEAQWYLEKYPHIAALFEGGPEVGKSVPIAIGSPQERKPETDKCSNEDSDLSITNSLNQ
jgi:hypothetical protein